MIRVEFSENKLTINSTCVVDLPYPIKDAFALSGVVVVFLDPNANLGKSDQYRNLLGFDRQGNKLWEAELPTSKTSDVYWRIKQKTPLVVSSFSSYECQVDELNGKVITTEFYK
ncbi:MAG: hypothetical protein A6F71_03425 [Cycloclasticus sp. symbiont of Poecilosclerida sp. M]|nr:MAG: hypothetical protein A6F71_03425 [Cycloclasticus sp. symbiont of Poecilosclerida sp. M]